MITEGVLVGTALAMDALSVTVVVSCSKKALNCSLFRLIFMCFLFGFFQFFMPLLGWGLGSLVAGVLSKIGSYIGAAILAVLGGKMLFEKDGDAIVSTRLTVLLLLALATSIDALLVGFGYAVSQSLDFILFSIVIGITTFIISLFGIALGKFFGSILKNNCGKFGGLILIAIAIKMLC